MTEVRSYDSMEEAFRDMAAHEAAANATLAAAQRMVTYGDYWFRPMQTGPGSPPLMIFGYVETLPEVTELEGQYYDLSNDEDRLELEATLAGIRDRHERGYMFGRCYSVVEPEGEWGDTHRANLWPITQAVFESARAKGWDLNEMPQSDKYIVVGAYSTWREHARQTAARNRKARQGANPPR